MHSLTLGRSTGSRLRRMLGRLFLTLEMRPAARLGARSPIRQPPVPTSYLVGGQTSTIPLRALATVHCRGWCKGGGVGAFPDSPSPFCRSFGSQSSAGIPPSPSTSTDVRRSLDSRRSGGKKKLVRSKERGREEERNGKVRGTDGWNNGRG